LPELLRQGRAKDWKLKTVVHAEFGSNKLIPAIFGNFGDYGN